MSLGLLLTSHEDQIPRLDPELGDKPLRFLETKIAGDRVVLSLYKNRNYSFCSD